MDDSIENLSQAGELPPEKKAPPFELVELQKISLAPGDVLAVKLVGDDFDVDTMESLRDSLRQVFTNNKVMVFQMPKDSDIQFSAIETQPAQNYCSDCSCGKKERAENV